MILKIFILLVYLQTSLRRRHKQYDFIKNDLGNISKNSNIDWIIVHQHKPLYSSNNYQDVSEELRNIYHPLFDKYNVDLVISSHNNTMKEHTHSFIILKMMKIQYISMILNLLTVFIIQMVSYF